MLFCLGFFVVELEPREVEAVFYLVHGRCERLWPAGAAPGGAGPGRRERPLLSRRGRAAPPQPQPGLALCCRTCAGSAPVLPASPGSSACSSIPERDGIVKCNLEDLVLLRHCKEHFLKLKQWNFSIEKL